MKSLYILVILVLLADAPSWAGLTGKKLIEYGTGFPTTEFYRDHHHEMEKIGFDGVVIRPMGRGETPWSFGYEVFRKTRINPKDIEPLIADLKSVKSPGMTENFIQMASGTETSIDWFDPEWESVAYNASIIARLAKQGNCRGIMLDPEEYGTSTWWSYRKLSPELKEKHSFSEYRTQVRRRGREFIQAINREYPGITLLCLLGPSFSRMKSSRLPRSESNYSLLADFFDGMCEAADEKTNIIDGFEQSYYYRNRFFFRDARQLILQDILSFTAVPEAYRKCLSVGFGVRMDGVYGGAEWNLTDFSKNFFTPTEFRNTLAYALEYTDRYVWVWTETPRWWVRDKLPEEYVQALKLSKQGPDLKVKERDFPYKAPRASTLDGYTDEETFSKFHKSMAEIFDFPKDGWRFHRDPTFNGQSKLWHTADFDDSKWRTISIGEFWENQGEFYDGPAWYRRTVRIPELPEGKRIFMAFGAVDETATVYINGRWAGKHDIGEQGWDTPFRFDVTELLKPGQLNHFAIRVGDTGQLGGIWKSIKLMVDTPAPISGNTVVK